MSNNIDLYIQEIEGSKQQIKNAIIAKGVTPTGGLTSYAGAISQIVSEPDLEVLEVTIEENGLYQYNSDADGYSDVKVTVDIPIPTFETQSKSVEIKKNGTQTITPDSGYDGLSSVEVKVNVASTTGKTPIPNGFRFTGGDMAKVDFSQYDWSMVYDTAEFFRGCSHSTGDWSNFIENFNGEIMNLNYMFGVAGDKNATSIYDGVSSLPNLGSLTARSYDASYMCYNNKNLTDVSNLKFWDTSNIINTSNMFAAYDQQKNAPQITSIDLTGFGHPEGYNAEYMFKYSPVQTVKGLNVRGSTEGMFNTSGIVSLEDCNFTDLTSTANMFAYCSKLVSVPLFDTSNVTNMSSMFYNCSKLISVPLFDTSNVTNMNSMFKSCIKLTSVPQIDVRNVTNVTSMFAGSTASSVLRSLPDFNFINLKNFGGSSSYSWLYDLHLCLESIGVIDCDSITDISYVFGRTTCTYLTHLGGFRNLGKASSVSGTNGNYFMTYAPNLTYESVMNVINLLYDRAANGLSTLTLKLHTNHMAMLSDDDIAIATNKGWTLTA